MRTLRNCPTLTWMPYFFIPFTHQQQFLNPLTPAGDGIMAPLLRYYEYKLIYLSVIALENQGSISTTKAKTVGHDSI